MGVLLRFPALNYWVEEAAQASLYRSIFSWPRMLCVRKARLAVVDNLSNETCLARRSQVCAFSRHFRALQPSAQAYPGPKQPLVSGDGKRKALHRLNALTPPIPGDLLGALTFAAVSKPQARRSADEVVAGSHVEHLDGALRGHEAAAARRRALNG
jgi:hypothetical protein